MRCVVALVVALAALGCGNNSGDEDENDSDGLLQVEPLPPLEPGWSLALNHQIGSPAPDPTGITFDGTQIWLISGGHNASKHRLVRYDDRNFVVTRDFLFENLIEVLGTGVYGIAWDGSYIWISVSGNRNKLVAVDPNTGAIVRTWASPTVLGPSDLSFDATQMWISDGGGSVFSMNVTSGAITSSFSTSAAFTRNTGVVALTGQLLVNSLFGEGLALFTTSGDLISTNPTVTATNGLGPLCLARNQLLTVNLGQIVYYDVQN